MVLEVGHVDEQGTAAIVDRDSGGKLELTLVDPLGSELEQEHSVAGELLHAVELIADVHVALGVNGHAARRSELAIPGTERPPLAHAGNPSARPRASREFGGSSCRTPRCTPDRRLRPRPR